MPALPQALWYFQDQTIALARDHATVAGFATGMSAMDDVSAWFHATPNIARPSPPPLVWIGAPGIARGARLHRDPLELRNVQQRIALRFAPRLASNRSWIDGSTLAFLESRTLTARGDLADDGFVARTFWPDDFRIDASTTQSTGAAASMRDIGDLIRGVPDAARSPFSAHLLWERTPGERAWRGKPVLALMLNGAQGDDDEAHGGHFAIVTGRMEDDGAIGDWMVNNFYALDTTSEKGILAAPVPLDNYLADLNSGQAWYRPSWMMVAVLAEDRVAATIQSALGRVYNHFYRHDLVYDHATMNCTGISVDTLRALGWPVAREGPTSRALAIAGVPWFALRTASLTKAARNYDYLTEDRTRLFPAVAFEAIGADMLACARAKRGVGGTPPAPADASLLAWLAQDVDAFVLLRIPQLPSSRAWGAPPAETAWEYQARVPKDPAQVQIIPVSPRPFPARLLADDVRPPPLSRGSKALLAWGAALAVGRRVVGRRVAPARAVASGAWPGEIRPVTSMAWVAVRIASTSLSEPLGISAGVSERPLAREPPNDLKCEPFSLLFAVASDRPMLQILVITMREGIEAFLIVAITAGILRQTGRGALLPALYWGTGLAIIVSFIASLFFAQAENKPLWEGHSRRGRRGNGRLDDHLHVAARTHHARQHRRQYRRGHAGSSESRRVVGRVLFRDAHDRARRHGDRAAAVDAVPPGG